MQAAHTKSLVDQLGLVGVKLFLTNVGALAVSPASLLTDDLRALIRAGKSGLIDWLKAANDPTPCPNNAAPDIGTIRAPDLSPTLMAASLALDFSIVAEGVTPSVDPDANCWPHSTAMNGTELDLFAARLHRFTNKGLNYIDSEALADKLVIRDRETDDRQSCLECKHLSGYGHTNWRCGNWQAAGIAIRLSDTQLPADLVLQLQRCDGFATATPDANAKATSNLIGAPFLKEPS